MTCLALKHTLKQPIGYESALLAVFKDAHTPFHIRGAELECEHISVQDLIGSARVIHFIDITQ